MAVPKDQLRVDLGFDWNDIILGPFLVHPDHDNLGQRDIDQNDQQVQSINAEDRDWLDQPGLACQRVAGKPHSAQEWDKAADHLKSNPGSQSLQDEPAEAGQFMELPLCACKES